MSYPLSVTTAESPVTTVHRWVYSYSIVARGADTTLRIYKNTVDDSNLLWQDTCLAVDMNKPFAFPDGAPLSGDTNADIIVIAVSGPNGRALLTMG